MLYPKCRTNRPILKVVSDDILIISAIGSNGNIKQLLLWTTNPFSCKMYFHYLIWLWFALSHSDSKIYEACKEICFCKVGTMFVNCSGVHALVFNLTFPSDAEHLDLSQNNLYSIPWKSISSLWKLQVLLLSSNSIHKVGENTFISLGRLHKLDIGRNDISFLGNSFSVGLISLHELILAYNKLQDVRRLILDDYYNVTCMEPHLLRNLPLSAVDTELCIAETVTVLVITFTVFVTVVAAIVMAERNRKKRAEKRWNEDSDISYNAQN
uniref:Leucine rich repeat containing 70 n=1 Tax=Pseudonaja textilis TaxID=8673 RepID=A0A670Y1V1_PSETE